MRAALSTTRAAILIGLSREVANSARAHREVSGTAVHRIGRNRLARGLRHEVRSEARWRLCTLIGFSAWPRAQQRRSRSRASMWGHYSTLASPTGGGGIFVAHRNREHPEPRYLDRRVFVAHRIRADPSCTPPVARRSRVPARPRATEPLRRRSQPPLLVSDRCRIEAKIECPVNGRHRTPRLPA